ncbi:hypothetical protein EXIGLDRAFT_843083 [Exidia glandulosa HHB12029]|uniref:Fe2OG dioxygenase domain-containing protein n=1 Tax=Exidia glandulosa HHB12029 TaxID=1314781 RepID=A0A165CWB3_EXIGL|nr:hypothetical protein EXIGLDRAFT_843083 [Exidia glandulosa HHB12029]
MSVSDAQRALILDALVDPKPFYGEGVHEFPAHQLFLFASRQTPVCVNLSKDGASADELEKLASVCQAATFGRNQVDVLDESYRKAGKLDSDDFALNLDIVSSGFLDKVHDALFGWEGRSREIQAELYKLNVYRTGSFFKAHNDTPRGTNMFGSLVLTFATPHEGGQLALHHDGHEHIHDTSATSAQYQSDHQVSWVAFFSDVEHEVLPVTSGHRVTLTYNLYFRTETEPCVRPKKSDALVQAFKTLLADATFMPDGGRLGFGLKHQYPFPSNGRGSRFLKETSRSLKSMDSALFNAIEAAGLAPQLRLWYWLDSGDGSQYLLPYIWEAREEQIEDVEDYDMPKEYQITAGDYDDEDDPRFKNFVWMVSRNSNTSVPSQYMHYGNEASISYLYGDLVLVADVPPANERLST